LGVEAGCNAGMQVVMVPDKRLNPSFTSKATISISNLHQLNLEEFGLPAYPYKPVTHVIFDMDGLLLNTQTMYSSVSARILAQHGKEPDYNFKVCKC
jgi:beta-phosphoglucomutase-like phosphatase (HAD superfamily)